ncbi:MAG: hypothetical protein ABW152_12830 [Candidatus Thiodiazotropha endolucinida]
MSQIHLMQGILELNQENSYLQLDNVDEITMWQRTGSSVSYQQIE